jgi:hypothetical protein
MNDNYLWDKSGEPDEEIQQLESLLSEFRYQARPLVLPEAELGRLPKAKAIIFSFVNVRYAALAAMILLALGVGIWLSVRPTTNALDQTTATATPAPHVLPTPPVAPSPAAPSFVRQLQPRAPKAQFAVHKPKRASRKSFAAEGERAKEKVLYALRITSEKLNIISKKVQADTN